MNLDKEAIGGKLGGLAKNAGKLTADLSGKTKELIVRSKDSVVNTIDINKDGKVDIEDIITLGLKTPGGGH